MKSEVYNPEVSIILPCLNEAEILEDSVNQIKKVMDKTKYSYEIIIERNELFYVIKKE